MKIIVRTAKQDDFLNVHEFVDNVEVIDTHPPFFYKIILRYFGDTCFIAEKGGEIVGFLLGFVSQNNPDNLFIWQIGVNPNMRKKGIAQKMLAEEEKEVKKRGCKRIEVTIAPENTVSKKLFEKLGYKNVSYREGETIEVKGSTTVKDYYKPDRHFILYEKEV